jgi:hypothetical protein
MKPSVRSRLLAAAAVALGLLGAASAAQARSDVYVSIGVMGAPNPYFQPQPVYVTPRPVYVQPRPVYVQPTPVYVTPRPVYVQPVTPVYARSGFYYEERHDGRRAEWQRRHGRHHQDQHHGRGRDRHWD